MTPDQRCFADLSDKATGVMGETTHILFGRHGNSMQYLLGGWAHDNKRQTWTIGHESHAVLPRPRRRGTYVLTITGIAFTAQPVPFQRLMVVANGIEVGRFLLREPFKIDCVLPWTLLADAEALAIAFRHPDAVRPRDVIDSGDHRWLAIAFHELVLTRAPPGTPEPRLPDSIAPDDEALPPALRHRALVAFGPRNVEFRRPSADWPGRPAFGHFADAVARDPRRAAIDDGRQAVTYAEAMQYAASLAARIGEATPPGSTVAICLPPGLWLPIAILACLAAGRSCALLDPVAAAAKGPVAPALQIGQAGVAAVFPGVPRIVLPTAQPPRAIVGVRLPAMQATAFLVPSGTADAGWSGIGEAAMLRDIAAYIETAHLNDADHHLPVGPTASVATIRTVLAALLTGGTLHAVDLAGTDSPPLGNAPITVCSGPLDALLALTRLGGGYACLRTARLVRVEGGTLRWNDVATLRSLLPKSSDILHTFGTAETLTCIQHFVTMPAAGAGDIVPAGFALPGFAVSVMAPEGEIGELVVRAPLMRDSIRTGQRARHQADGVFSCVPDAGAVQLPPRADADHAPGAYDAVCAAWEAVLGMQPRTGEVFGAAGGDSLKLIEFAVELENRLKRRLEMSLLTLEMDAPGIAAALEAADATAARPPALLAHELVAHFESLGSACEFGFLQRACQVEPYSLLRFAGTTVNALIAALESRFEGFGDADRLAIDLKPDNEYRVREQRFGIAFHTDIFEDQITHADMIVRESRRLGFLARRMCDDLAAARRIYVYRSHGPQEDDSVAALHRALRLHGPNRLIWVMSADAEHPMGTTRRIGDSLMLGYVDPRAVVDEGRTVRVETWLAVCAAAHRLFSEQQQPALRSA